MGGDYGSRPCVLAAQKFAHAFPNTFLRLFGDFAELSQYFTGALPDNISIEPADGVVLASDTLKSILRSKRSSSMAMAVNAVAKGEADACVSGGNTGALLAFGRHYIKPVVGLTRPAICRAIPTRTGVTYMLDLGANLHCNADNLYQFGVMGAALAQVSGVIKPKVALLNVGSEVSKGSDEVRRAAALLKAGQNGYQYQGFIEGDELFRGEVDVVVCDGFSGNVALKVSEGLVKHLITSLDEFFKQSWLGRASRLLVGPLLRSWSRKKNPSLYNGAAFLGLQKTVIKSHGAADALGIYKALEFARGQVLLQTPEKISNYFQAN